jgi:predicted Zn-dependent protease
MSLYSNVLVEMAVAKIAEGDVNGAEALFRKALTQSPDDVDALVGYAKLLMTRSAGHASAEKLLKRACELEPKSANPRVVLAELYHSMGRPAQARAEITEAERLEPSNAAVRVVTRRSDRSPEGLLQRLKKLAGFGTGSRKHDGAAQVTLAHHGVACGYCGNRQRPGARVCGRCGATL